MSHIQSIAIDMDQVITDTLKKELALYNKLFKKNMKKEDLVGKTLAGELSSEEWKILYDKVNTKGFFRDLEFIDKKAPEVIEALNERYDVYICTAAMEVPNSFEDKYLWLSENLPFLDKNKFIFCGFKYVIGTDVLIDDSPYQLRRVRGESIVYNSPFNQNLDLPYRRVYNWQEIAEEFL